MGFDFKAEEEFPPDDSGYGFDNIADVLSVSPLLLEKYIQAAEAIVTAAVPTISRFMPERTYRGIEFRAEGGGGNGDRMSIYKKAKVKRLISADVDGDYRLSIEISVHGSFVYDPGKCVLIAKFDEKELLRENYAWQDGKIYRYSFTRAAQGRRPSSELRDRAVIKAHVREEQDLGRRADRHGEVSGPSGSEALVAPEELRPVLLESRSLRRATTSDGSTLATSWADSRRRHFAGRSMPKRSTGWWRWRRGFTSCRGSGSSRGWRGPWWPCSRRLASFSASRRHAARHRLAAAEGTCRLTSTRWHRGFPTFCGRPCPIMSYSRRPRRGELRKNLSQQVKRMQDDPRGEALTRNFVGQWLEVRDVDGFNINTRAVLRAEGSRARIELDGQTRRAMRGETEMIFAYIVREDRSVLELIDSDYTFLNAKLAELYGIKDVSGTQMRKVSLPKDSPRGGVIAHASVLLVTSNPTRTSPVKRGQFILENLLGTPAPPPPGVVPTLEESKKQFKDREPTGRELLAIHRAAPLCASCHERLDPLGLALENFNAMGLWRDKERGQPIDSTGKLISGESFHDVRELKRILKEKHKQDFYRCIAEKLLTYALGRGLDYNDVESVDQIVERLEKSDGRFSALLLGVIESAPFQKRRSVSAAGTGSSGSRELSHQAQSKP